MIKLERTSVMNLENAIRGARNPMNSWAKMDSHYDENGNYILGPNDLDLAKRLRTAGSDHRKFLRQIMVCVDITAPFYWWKEFDTYKVGTVANSCSTMHKILSKPIEMSDFSIDGSCFENEAFRTMIQKTVENCEDLRKICLAYKDQAKKTDCFSAEEIESAKKNEKEAWRGLIQLLPESFNQMRTVTLNYETLVNICHSRKGHKLNEWHTLIDWAMSLPYARELIAD